MDSVYNTQMSPLDILCKRPSFDNTSCQKNYAITLIAFLFLFFFCVSVNGQPFKYAKEITINASQVSGSAPLLNFPMLFSVIDPDLRTVANGGRVKDDTGLDIIFTLESCSPVLSHEIEKYDPTTGEFIAWINIPTLHNSINTIIHMYYDSDSPATYYTVTSPWPSDYENVYHMNQDPSGTAPQIVNSSTFTSRDATSGGNMTSGDLVTGQIGNALEFDGVNDDLDARSIIGAQPDVTYSGWINLNGFQTPPQSNFPAIIIDRPSNAGVHIANDNEIRIQWNSGHFLTNTGLILTPSEWVYFAFVNSAGAGQSRMYIGKSGSVSSFTYSADVGSTSFIGQMSFASQPGSFHPQPPRYIAGTLDEIRVLSTTLSEDWITTEYNNQYSPSTFYTVGQEMLSYVLCATLPIELIEFTGRVNENGKVDLKWSTASETDNAYFTIERSSDGRVFEVAKRISGAGTSIDLLHYDYTDTSPLPGVNYYRLRQTDFDGTSTLSEIVRVNAPKSSGYLRVYPNPSTGEITIKGDNFKSGGSIYIYDLFGSLQKSFVLTENATRVVLELHDLPEGIYQLTIQTVDGIKVSKIVLH